MSEAIVLEAEKREIIGKKVKQLRAVGRIPGVIYGPDQPPVHVVMNWPQLRSVLSQAGGTGLVEVKVNGQSYVTLVRVVDRHPVKRNVLHVDFYAVNLHETLVSTVHVALDNLESTRVRIGGQIIQESLTVEIESLPTDIPKEIILDVSKLKQVGDALHVSDLPALEGVTYVSEPSMLIVRTEYIAVEEEEVEVEEEAAEATPVEPERVTRRKEEFVEEEE